MVENIFNNYSRSHCRFSAVFYNNNEVLKKKWINNFKETIDP